MSKGKPVEISNPFAMRALLASQRKTQDSLRRVRARVQKPLPMPVGMEGILGAIERISGMVLEQRHEIARVVDTVEDIVAKAVDAEKKEVRH